MTAPRTREPTRPASAARWRRLHRLVVTAGLATMLALPLAVAAPTTAQAAGQAGYCPDATGVTVVVDFQALGGGVVVRCAPAPLPGSGTGLDALVAAGIPLEGVRRWGDSFICRLAGQPAVSASLAVTGRPGYHEQCLDTPPAAAFWGYWSASNGGSWQYSQQGVKSHRATVGGFEGWSFSLNATGSGNPAPRLTPTRPAAPAAPVPAPSPAVGSGAAPKSGAGSGSATIGSGAAASTPAPRGGQGAGPATGSPLVPGAAPRTATITPGGTPTSGATASPATTAPGATAVPTDPPTDAPTDAPVVSGRLASAPTAASGSSGPSTGTVVGVGLLAFLLVVGSGTAWRRRRGASE